MFCYTYFLYFLLLYRKYVLYLQYQIKLIQIKG
nr:MAG TPA: hypothetical protein [Caudoviricetes sp.]